MDYDRKANGWVTFLEHYWFLVSGVGVVLGTWILNFFTKLTGTSWIWCYAIALFVAATAVTLIFYAKLPLYQQHRFFTFGAAALPESRRSFYRWGYRCAIFAIALLLCLLLSRP